MIYYLLLFLFFINLTLIGGILPLIERKYLSLIQRRVGPKFVGYKGRFQFIADALKMFLKSKTSIYSISTVYFTLIPSIYLSLSYLLFLNLNWSSHLTLFDLELNLLLIPTVNIYMSLGIFMVGFLSRNKYGLLSSLRLILILVCGEFIITTVYLIFVFILKSFCIAAAGLVSREHSPVFLVTYSLGGLILSLLIEVSKSPFDVVEAETELVTGFHTEYGAFFFALFYLGEYFHIFFASALIIFVISGWY